MPSTPKCCNTATSSFRGKPLACPNYHRRGEWWHSLAGVRGSIATAPEAGYTRTTPLGMAGRGVSRFRSGSQRTSKSSRTTLTDAGKLTCGEVRLDGEVSGRHEVRVRVRVDTRGGNHKVHDRGGTAAGVKLVRRCHAAAFGLDIDDGKVPVDVSAARREAADEDDGPVCECSCSGTSASPAWRARRVVEPLAVCGEQVGLGTRVEYTNSLSAIVVAVDVVIGQGRRWPT